MAHLINVHFRKHIGKMRSDPGGGSEFRFPVLMYGIMGANPRGRFWHSQELIAEHLGTYKPRINEAINWLIEAGAIRVVPRDKREFEETSIRGHVYEITGYIELHGERYRYLHLAKSFGTDSVPEEDTESVPQKKNGTDSVEIGTDSVTVSGTDSAGNGTDSASLHYREENQEENQISEDHHHQDNARARDTSATPTPATAPGDDDEELANLLELWKSVFSQNPGKKDAAFLRKFKADYGAAVVSEALGRANGNSAIKIPVKWLESVLCNDYCSLADIAAQKARNAEFIEGLRKGFAPRPRPEPPAPQINWNPPKMPAADVWIATLSQLQMQLREATYNSRLKDAQLIASEDGLLTVWVPNDYTRDWLTQRLYRLIQHTAAHLAGVALELRFVSADPGETLTEARPEPDPPPDEGAEATPPERESGDDPQLPAEAVGSADTHTVNRARQKAVHAAFGNGDAKTELATKADAQKRDAAVGALTSEGLKQLTARAGGGA